MTRIISGTARGRRLAVPAESTRPTSDRAREGLFNSLAARMDFDGVRVLDLYAGSGAVGLEAMSRGAEHARFVESDRRAVTVLTANIRTVLGPNPPGAAVDGRDVDAVLAGIAPSLPFDLVFADPPYALEDDRIGAVLSALTGPGWLADGAIVVVERSARGDEPHWPVGLERFASKRYGEALLWYGRC
jgi:16S rRNA (guanine966-N2)-methyltransferase